MEFVVLHIVIIAFVGLIKWSSKPDKVDLEAIREQKILFNFSEFVKALILFSLPADKQKEIIEPGHVTLEMVNDLESYYTLEKYSYIGLSLINEDQKQIIDEFDAFLEERLQDQENDLLNDDALDTSPEWETIREKARNILKLLGKDDMTVAYERKQEGNAVFTKINLVMKTETKRRRDTEIKYE